MYDYIKGRIEELSPAEMILECNGIGYKIAISLNSYDKFRGSPEAKAYIYHHLREDEETLYGFYDKNERWIFTLLISVSGIGPNTARMMLSSLTADEVVKAIGNSDVNRIKAVKGIGAKTAQKVIIELKDKVSRGAGGDGPLLPADTNPFAKEACSALILLGFTKAAVEKTVYSIIAKENGISLEDIIKKALKML